MKKILAFISLLFLMVACSSTEDVKSSGNRNINSYRFVIFNGGLFFNRRSKK